MKGWDAVWRMAAGIKRRVMPISNEIQTAAGEAGYPMDLKTNVVQKPLQNLGVLKIVQSLTSPKLV